MNQRRVVGIERPAPEAYRGEVLLAEDAELET